MSHKKDAVVDYEVTLQYVYIHEKDPNKRIYWVCSSRKECQAPLADNPAYKLRLSAWATERNARLFNQAGKPKKGLWVYE